MILPLAPGDLEALGGVVVVADDEDLSAVGHGLWYSPTSLVRVCSGFSFSMALHRLLPSRGRGYLAPPFI